jgi:hypothetical protein
VVVPEQATKDDPEGFVRLDALRAQAKVSPSAEEFERSRPHPILIMLEGSDQGAGGAKKSPSASAFLIATLEGKGASATHRYHGRATFVAKRPGNPFPNMVSIGRATSNDIVIALETISKLHGYFLRENDAWFYTDYQSTNGTVINDKRVEKGEKRLVQDGDRIGLGLDIGAVFLLPRSLYERVRHG